MAATFALSLGDGVAASGWATARVIGDGGGGVPGAWGMALSAAPHREGPWWALAASGEAGAGGHVLAEAALSFPLDGGCVAPSAVVCARGGGVAALLGARTSWAF